MAPHNDAAASVALAPAGLSPGGSAGVPQKSNSSKSCTTFALAELRQEKSNSSKSCLFFCARANWPCGQWLRGGGPDRAGRRSAPLHGHAISTTSNSSKSCTTFALAELRQEKSNSSKSCLFFCARANWPCGQWLRGGGPDRAGRRSAPVHGRAIIKKQRCRPAAAAPAARPLRFGQLMPLHSRARPCISGYWRKKEVWNG